MAKPTVVVSPQSVGVCVERVCRLAARSGYRVIRRRRVTDIQLSDLDLERETFDRYAVRLKARCRDTTWPLGGRVSVTILGRLSSVEEGTEIVIIVRPSSPSLQRDRVRQIVWVAVLAMGLVACVIGAISTGGRLLWGLTGVYVLATVLSAVLAVRLFVQATRAIMSLLAGVVSASLATEDEAWITLLQ
jgi:hypothetical protein